MKVITLPGNPDFNASLADFFGRDSRDPAEFIPVKARSFASTEEHVEIQGNVRNESVFVVQSGSGSSGMDALLSHEDPAVRASAMKVLFGLTGIEGGDKLTNDSLGVFLTRQIKRSANDDFMQLLVTLDALKRANVGSIYCVMPFMPYLRQDRKDKPRVPISARMIADLIEKVAGVRLRGVITSEMHVAQEQGFFDGAVDNLPMTHLFAADFLQTMKATGLKPEDCVVISPDLGGEKRAESFAELISNGNISVFKKLRGEGQKVTNTLLVPHDSSDFGGVVKGKTVIIIDDMIDSGNSLNAAGANLKAMQAKTVYSYTTHPIFTEKAATAFLARGVDQLVTINTLPIPPYMKHTIDAGILRVLNGAPYFGEAMRENNGGSAKGQGSVSSLFSVDAIVDLYERANVKLGRSPVFGAPSPSA
jgi:ribose-phosphate pyrophosphokinase